jgi:hypothetical protein
MHEFRHWRQSGSAGRGFGDPRINRTEELLQQGNRGKRYELTSVCRVQSGELPLHAAPEPLFLEYFKSRTISA